MNLMGLSGGQYCPLSPEQVETVHESSLKILEKTGATSEQGPEDTLQLLDTPKPAYIPEQIDRAIRKKFNILL